MCVFIHASILCREYRNGLELNKPPLKGFRAFNHISCSLGPWEAVQSSETSKVDLCIFNFSCSQTSKQLLLVSQDSAKLIEPSHLHFHRRSLRDNRNITTDGQWFCIYFSLATMLSFFLLGLYFLFIKLIIGPLNVSRLLKISDHNFSESMVTF